MKRSQLNLLTGTLFLAVIGLSGCTGHDKMAMADGMKHDSTMMKTEPMDKSSKKMAEDRNKPAATEMNHSMDTMNVTVQEPMDTMKPAMENEMVPMESSVETPMEADMKPME
ncbi:hypothetical protein [Desulforhopalus sp. IMCC35007]|uniref:hypothetical protein n=1 Tax=Desulforhopalus sp. IMCC35007 TaxID=2569543 RepID=UPI0010AED632|nr:hypothetical protein [Desulforhopalus sp. IMCC35007]TKB06153.1 hypothetical protein FCL48_22075 [Desulforhopalus sp. IMCC35007]